VIRVEGRALTPPYTARQGFFSLSSRERGGVRAVSDGTQAAKAPHPNPLPEGEGTKH
jgi:hypothetical protein